MRTTRAPTAVSLATTGDRIDAANTIVARRPDVRILFTSGFSGHKSGRQDLIKGGAPFLSKPFDVSELLSAVDALFVG